MSLQSGLSTPKVKKRGLLKILDLLLLFTQYFSRFSSFNGWNVQFKFIYAMNSVPLSYRTVHLFVLYTVPLWVTMVEMHVTLQYHPKFLLYFKLYCTVDIRKFKLVF